MAQLKDLIVTGDSRVIGNNYTNNPKIAFGTCSTAAGTAEKAVVIDDPTWNLQVGDIVGVKFTNSNTAGTVKLNVNNSGAIQVSYNTSRPYTGTDQMITGYANRTILYQYDGTYWHWVFDTVNRNDNTYTTAKSWTAAGTAAKTATCHDYVAAANSWNIIQMCYANTSATALTLNINGQGAKPIYINGSASSTTNYTLPAGHYLVYYNGTNYYFRTDGKLTASITGDAATVNGKTVATNVPSGAVFTDTTYTFTTGDNNGQIKVTPSSGSASNISVKGLSDLAYISKGSGSSKYLREDGTWQTVSSGSGTVTGVTAGAGLNTTSNDTATDGGTISSSGTLHLTKSGVAAGTYQGLTVDKYGRVTSASNQGYVTTDTKNTAGSTNNANKLYLIGATSQAANPQTYSNNRLYYNNGLYSESYGSGGAQTSDISQSTTSLTLRADQDLIGYSKIQTKSTDIDIYSQKEDQSEKAEIALSGSNGTIQVSATTGVTIQDVVAPTNNSDAANKKYVDDTVAAAPDTKNTAGTTNSTSKIYLAGATEQSANPQTYSNVNCYASGGKLYSNAKEVVNLSDTQALTNKTYNGYTLAAASAKAVVTSIDTSASLPTSNAVKTFVEGKGYTTNTGTITGITMNGASKGTSGVVDLGTVLTAHQTIKTINNTSMTGSGNVSVQPTLVSGTNIKTINNTSLLGSGNISISSPTKTSDLMNDGEDGAHTYLANYSDDMVGVGVNDNGEFYWLEGGSSQTEHSLLPFHYLNPTPSSSDPFIIENNPTGMYFIKPQSGNASCYLKVNDSYTESQGFLTGWFIITNNHPTTDGETIGYIEWWSSGAHAKCAITYNSSRTSGIGWSGVNYNIGMATVAKTGSYNDLTDKPSVGEIHSGTGDPAADLGNDGDLYVKLG